MKSPSKTKGVRKETKGWAVIAKTTGNMVYMVGAHVIKNPRSLAIIFGPEYSIAPCVISYKLN